MREVVSKPDIGLNFPHQRAAMADSKMARCRITDETFTFGTKREGNYGDVSRIAGNDRQHVDDGFIRVPFTDVYKKMCDLPEERTVEGCNCIVYSDGATYEGQWRAGLPHGSGKLVFSTLVGKLPHAYVGQFNSGVIEGEGELWDGKGAKYQGQFKGALKHGGGAMYYEGVGGVYTGEWVGDLRNGQGSHFDSDGTEYHGRWAGDKRNGPGIGKFPPTETQVAEAAALGLSYAVEEGSGSAGDSSSGVAGTAAGSAGSTLGPGGFESVYRGQWKENLQHGDGMQTDAFNNVYEGTFRDGSKKKGKTTYASGHVYLGAFLNHFREGRGTMIEATQPGAANPSHPGSSTPELWPESGMPMKADAEIQRYDGNWKFNERSGQGRQMYSNGDLYRGAWVANNRHGAGFMQYADGSEYNGLWANDVREGQGTNTYAVDSISGQSKTHRDEFTGQTLQESVDRSKQPHANVIYDKFGFTYTGKWVDDKREGAGRMEYNGNFAADGKWDKDRLTTVNNNEMQQDGFARRAGAGCAVHRNIVGTTKQSDTVPNVMDPAFSVVYDKYRNQALNSSMSSVMSEGQIGSSSSGRVSNGKEEACLYRDLRSSQSISPGSPGSLSASMSGL